MYLGCLILCNPKRELKPKNLFGFSHSIAISYLGFIRLTTPFPGGVVVYVTSRKANERNDSHRAACHVIFRGVEKGTLYRYISIDLFV